MSEHQLVAEELCFPEIVYPLVADVAVTATFGLARNVTPPMSAVPPFVAAETEPLQYALLVEE